MLHVTKDLEFSGRKGHTVILGANLSGVSVAVVDK